ncbi:MAG: hypothetical protein Q7S96_01720 [bacterium]|nr:hypothetical protein [bacterium]
MALRIERFEHLGTESWKSFAERAKTREKIEVLIEKYFSSADSIGIGNNAEVFSERATTMGGTVCLKVENVYHPGDRLHNALDREAAIHSAAFEVLDVQRRTAGDGDWRNALGRTPQPFAFIAAAPEKGAPTKNFIAMERIVGVTLFRTIINHIAQHDARFASIRSADDVTTLRDEVLEQAVLTILDIRALPTRKQMEQILRTAEQHELRFSVETLLRVRNAMNTLNDAHIFHRDAHPKKSITRARNKRAIHY